jgi:DNA polymerase
MGAAMIRCERNGYPVVMTVHDELVVEVPDTPDNREHGVERVSMMMCRLPPWGRDLPLKVEGAIMTRYGK